MTYADTQALCWRWRHAFVEQHAGPQSPCLFVFGFWPTNPTVTARTAHGVTTLSLPESIRRRALTRRQDVLRLDGKRQREDSPRKGHEDHKRLALVTALAQPPCDVHIFVFVCARSNAGPQPRLAAAARHERRLAGVGCRPMLN